MFNNINKKPENKKKTKCITPSLLYDILNELI